MSKDFEKEYKEYLNAQAPNLWDRIEAGVDALEADALASGNSGITETEKTVSISGGKAKSLKRKRQIRYQHYRMIVSVAACLFALILIVPVYLLTRPAAKDSAATDSAPQILEDVTIQNLVVNSEESEAAAEESAPMEDIADGVTEIEIASEESAEETMELAQVEENNTGTGVAEATAVTGGGENGVQVAEAEKSVEEDAITDVVQEETERPQEEMQVIILGEGVIQEGGVVYAAAIVGSASSETISLLVPTENDIAFEMDKTYTLTVQKLQDNSCYMVVAVVE